jgi:hypothetical protein
MSGTHSNLVPTGGVVQYNPTQAEPVGQSAFAVQLGKLQLSSGICMQIPSGVLASGEKRQTAVALGQL